jgi:uncharacterized membrane protein (DUF485 family)
MKVEQYDWTTILNSTTFMKLQRKKTAFLFSLWVFGCLPYLLFTIGAGYVPELFRIRVIGRVNIGYLFCVCEFFMTIAIAMYYTFRTSKDFDPLTRELLDEIEKGEAR